ncbi:MAG: hypothetical protein KA004_01035 [Verrucomicrobiales bacterium]|nr:hypothetical protein [Verrucomicrobiales bacterium]
MSELAIILGVLLAAYGLRTFGHPLLRRLGALVFLTASFLAGYFLFGSWWAGALCVALWFLLPWLEIILRLRRMTLPLDKSFRKRHAPSGDEMPELRELTEEIRGLGFEQGDDVGWDWENMRQFIRFFAHPDDKVQAAIHLNVQGAVSLVFVSLVTRSSDGRIWITWNYPFSYNMKLAPEFTLHRATRADSFEQLLTEHLYFLGENEPLLDELTVAPPLEELQALMERELRRLVDHNLDAGIICLSGEGRFRYSWRGCFFLWGQFLKDMVRLS